MNRMGNAIIGAVFVLLGVLFLLYNFNILNYNGDIFSFGFLISKFWAVLFLIIPGIAFHSIFFSGKDRDAGVLVPGGILLVVGLTCQLSTLFNAWGVLWPGFILSPAVGLFELYMFGKREKGLLIPVFILGGLSLIFFYSFSMHWLFGNLFRQVFIPALLVLLGLLVIFKNRRGGKDF